MSRELLVDTCYFCLAFTPSFNNRAAFGEAHSFHVDWMWLPPSLRCGRETWTWSIRILYSSGHSDGSGMGTWSERNKNLFWALCPEPKGRMLSSQCGSTHNHVSPGLLTSILDSHGVRLSKRWRKPGHWWHTLKPQIQPCLKPDLLQELMCFPLLCGGAKLIWVGYLLLVSERSLL